MSPLIYFFKDINAEVKESINLTPKDKFEFEEGNLYNSGEGAGIVNKVTDKKITEDNIYII